MHTGPERSLIDIEAGKPFSLFEIVLTIRRHKRQKLIGEKVINDALHMVNSQIRMDKRHDKLKSLHRKIGVFPCRFAGGGGEAVHI